LPPSYSGTTRLGDTWLALGRELAWSAITYLRWNAVGAYTYVRQLGGVRTPNQFHGATRGLLLLLLHTPLT